jgi:hypothetical protein
MVQKCCRLLAAKEPSQKRSNRRIWLENLEDRTVPSTFKIANGDVAGLIAAIHAADSNSQDNTIILAKDGSYTLRAVDNTTDGSTGLPVIDNGSNSLTINGRGATISRSAAKATPGFRLLDVGVGSVVELRDLTLANGLETGPAAQGGAIYSQGNLTLRNTIVENNVAQGSAGTNGQPGATGGTGGSAQGGGIYQTGGSVTLGGGTTLNNNQVLGGNGGVGGDFGGNGGDAAGGHETQGYLQSPAAPRMGRSGRPVCDPQR